MADENGNIWWEPVCGSSDFNNDSDTWAFWSFSMTVNNTDPDFTQCFQHTVLSWAPCAWLWLCSIFYLPYLINRKTANPRLREHSALNITKTVVCVFICLLVLLDLAKAIAENVDGLTPRVAMYISPAVYLLTFALAAFIIYLEFTKGAHSSGVIFVFWILLLLFGVVPFRTNILDAMREGRVTDSFRFVTFYIFYALVLLEFVLHLFADAAAIPGIKPVDEEKQPLLRPVADTKNKVIYKNPCPELKASFISRVTFWWITGLIIRGYKKALTFTDLWDLNVEDKTKSVWPTFEQNWDKEIDKYKEATSAVPHYKFPKQVVKAQPGRPGRPTNGGPEQSKQKTDDVNIDPHENIDPVIMKAFKTGSLFKAISKTFGSKYLLSGFYKLIYDLVSFVNPQILNLLIAFVGSGDPFLWRGYIYAVSLFVVSVFKSIMFQQYWHGCYVTGLRVRTAVIAAVYRKSIRLNNAAKKSSTVGEVVNLMAVDSQKLLEAPPFLHMVWSAPFTIAVAIYFLWQQLGPSVLAGLGVTILMVPINGFIATRIRKYQIAQMRLKDGRIRLMNEVLSGMKVLKLYAWEGAFQDKILEIRNREIAVLKSSAILQAVSSISWFCAPFLVALASFGTFVSVSETNILTAQRAFVSLSLFNIMNYPMSILPATITYAVQAAVSIGRLGRFLKNPELDPDNVSYESNYESVMTIDDGTFAWDKDEEPILNNINIKIPDGKLVAVVGMVGCGKSSLMSAILGDMDVISGKVSLRGSIAYVPQQAWIQFNTLKNNIIFGAHEDKNKYDKIISATALKADLEILPGGDQTEIGEKGINLSGGQKQRVSLARAVYQDKDIYLLDDPLSAVDSHVGKHIFDNVIGPKGVLKNKTRILSTNAINILPKCDEIIVLNNGRISEIGPYNELLEKAGAFSEYIATYLNENESDDDESDEEIIQQKQELKRLVSQTGMSSGKSDGETESMRSGSIHSGGRGSVRRRRSSRRKRTISTKSGGSVAEEDLEAIKKSEKKNKLVLDEVAQEGSVKASVFLGYLKACRIAYCIVALIAYLAYMACQVGTNIWLSEWSNDPPLLVNGTLVQDKPQTNLRLGVYGAFGAGSAITVLIQSLVIALGSIFASITLHADLLHAIVRAPMAFFDTTPLGRLINRFSKDVDTIDINIPMTLRIALATLASVIMTIIVIIYTTPIFVVVILPLSVFYFFVQRFYVATSRQLKRLESVNRSPIYSHFSETVVGTSSIRAYGKVGDFVLKSDDLVDENQKAYYPNIVSNRWLGISLEFIGNIIVLFAGLFAVLGRETLNAGLVGLSVSYSLQITSALNYMVRMATDLETFVVSVERVKEYSEVANEAPWEVPGNTPSDAWPEAGAIDFDDYSVRYRDGLDLVLRGITFNVKPGEKVGIVGRTGAGKSSLTLALFRIIEAAGGSIIIDGKNVSHIGLHSLRSKLTIIPQEPVLFSGSLRMNLDPTDIRGDDEIWDALEHAHLKEFVVSLPDKLMHPCSEGGENLSVGQRQLVCLARALLRKTKILILDEATAAVDLETDDLIQNTIRTEFKDSTIVTIAHRLNTIMDYDRILVLDAGKTKEYDSPTALLADKSTVFYGMAKDAGLV
ncbi:unnamed protein product [Owenia fusiformis]|uniref:ABC-type glutathione-S-conjugate transporter n=1 Tax=Owenia fusiformis TaxID=6347 RepID=A0A8J1Y6B4_OWEFU|nr:unnamed protein product [Owenia fusiformis]